MATLRSQGDKVLVVREVSAPLPDLDETKRSVKGLGYLARKGGLHADVTVISQFADEDGHAFTERVLQRVARDLTHGFAYRAAVISAGRDLSQASTDARAHLSHSLAALLAPRPNSVLLIRAPMNASEGTRAHLFDLMESTARGAANLAIQVAFPAN